MSDWADDDSMSTNETMRRFESLNPQPTTGRLDWNRNRVVQAVANAIWQHGLNTSGTAGSAITHELTKLAESITDVFTCAECGFLDASIGNSFGECNDCAPRVSRRKPRCGSRYDSPREGDDCYCVCAKASGHTGRHVCCCDERWTDEQATS